MQPLVMIVMEKALLLELLMRYNMKRYWNSRFVEKDFGNCTGTCPVCTIKCWEKTGNKPAIFPCGIENCPHETKEFQKTLVKTVDYFRRNDLV